MAARMMGAEQKGRGPPTVTAAAMSAVVGEDDGGAMRCTLLHSDTLMNMPSAMSDSGICISENCARTRQIQLCLQSVSPRPVPLTAYPCEIVAFTEHRMYRWGGTPKSSLSYWTLPRKWLPINYQAF